MKLARDGFTTFSRLDGIQHTSTRSFRTRLATCASAGTSWAMRAGRASSKARRLDLVGAASEHPHARRLLRWPTFRLVRARRGEGAGAGSSKGRRFGPATANSGWARRKACSASQPRPGSPTSRPRDRSRCTAAATASPSRGCAGCSKTPPATSGSRRKTTGVNGLARWEASGERVREFAQSPGLAMAQPVSRTLVRRGCLWRHLDWLRRRDRPIRARSVQDLRRGRGTAARRDQGHPSGPLGSALARVRAGRTGSRGSRRVGAPGVRRVHDRSGAVE